MKVIPREKAFSALKHWMLELEIGESHHNHPIIQDDAGTLRWFKDPNLNPYLEDLALKGITLNDIVPLIQVMGYDKNSEVYRKLYRDLGYSLLGYWEVFYWEMNNPYSSEYKPNRSFYGE